MKKYNRRTRRTYPIFDEVELYMISPETNEKVFATIHSDKTMTFAKGTKFKRAIKNISNYNLSKVKPSFDEAKSRDDIKISGDYNSYSVEYIEDVTYNSPSKASYLIFGGLPLVYTAWRIKSSGEPLDSLRNKKD